MKTLSSRQALRSTVLVGLSCFWIPQTLEAQASTREEAKPARRAQSKALSESERALVLQQIDSIAFLDQQFRRYTANGTLDEAVLARVKKMELAELIAFKRSHKDELTKEQRELMWELQRRNDPRNHKAFVALVKTYGYPSPKRLGVKIYRLYPLLLHPPCKLAEVPAHIEAMRALLEPEVLAGNMTPRSFATFVDNMYAKILRKAQIYGTNKGFSSKLRKELPPIIADIEVTNRARRKIGLPELREGEYRLAKSPAPAAAARDATAPAKKGKR